MIFKKIIWFHNLFKAPFFQNMFTLHWYDYLLSPSVEFSVYFQKKMLSTNDCEECMKIIWLRWIRQKRLIYHITSEHVSLNWSLNLVCRFHRQRPKSYCTRLFNSLLETKKWQTKQNKISIDVIKKLLFKLFQHYLLFQNNWIRTYF